MAEREPVADRRIAQPRPSRRAVAGWGIAIAIGSVLVSAGLLWVSPEAFDSLYSVSRGDFRSLEGNATAELTTALTSELTHTSLPDGGRVLLRSSPADARYFAETGGDYPRVLRQTEASLVASSLHVEQTRTLLAPGRNDELLVLDHAFCLSNAQWDSLLAYVRSGGALAAFGPCAVRDERGAWVGWDRMLSLIGARAVQTLPSGQADFVTVGRATPLAPGWLQGYRIGMRRGEGVIGAECADVSGSLAYWSRFDRSPTQDRDAPLAAVVACTEGQGRVVWAGFPLGWIDEQPENDRAARVLLGRAFTWARSGSPVAELSPWPEGAEAAVLLELDTEDQFANAALFADALEARELRGTFLCVSRLAKHEAKLVQRLAARHEVGSHTVDHHVIEGRPLAEQTKRLAQSKRDLHRLGPTSVTSFRPPEERWDAASLTAMARAGFRSLVAGRHPQALPEITVIDPENGEAPVQLVRIPRTGPDDFELFLHGDHNAHQTSPSLRRALEQVRRYEGINVVSLHTAILCRPENIPHLRPFLDSIREAPVWIPTVAECSDWWLTRAASELTVESVAAHHFRLTLRNPADRSLAASVARLSLPENPASLVVIRSSDKLAQAIEGPDARGVYSLAMPEVPAGGAVRVELSTRAGASAAR